MTVSGLLPLLIFFVWLVMLPFVFGQVFAAALIKFKLEPTTAPARGDWYLHGKSD